MLPFDDDALGSAAGRPTGVDLVPGDFEARDRLDDVLPNADFNMVAGLAGMSYCAGVMPRRSSMTRNLISAWRHS